MNDRTLRAPHRLARLVAVLAVTCTAALAQVPIPAVPVKSAAPQSSTSGTGQFVIHGADLATRGAFCLLCDDVAAALGRLMRDDARFVLPIVIVLKHPPDASQTGPAVSTSISQLAHGGFHLQVNAALRADFRGDDFAREIVRTLLAERILRNHKELKTTRQRVLPDWVLTGVTQALEFRGRSRPSALFAAVFRSGQVFSIDKILAADPTQLDALARGIYETSTCALVLALLEQQDGPTRFAKFLGALARDDKSDRDLLKQHFPTLAASKNSLEKWWSLQMAALATPSPLESLGVDETEARLRDALTLVFKPAADGERKKKSKSAPADKKPPAEEKPAGGRKAAAAAEPAMEAEERPPLPGLTLPGLPFFGGKKVLFAPASDSNTDAETAPAKKPSRSQPDPAPAADNTAREETKTKTPRGGLLNPRNWFRDKHKQPDEETEKKKETPEKKSPEKGSVPTEPAKKSAPAREEPPARASEKPRPTGPPIEEFASVWDRSDRDKIFQRNLDQLNALRLQAHPLYRPLITGYIEIVRNLIQGKQRGVADKLAALRVQQAQIQEQARAIESHLDWHEASQTRSYSGVFDDYLRLRDRLEKEGRSRNDALSRYLDTLAREYE